jgi:Flp pilus assembly protein TadD
VDTRSDVYALGVLLYELLTGTTPLERPRLRQAAFGEIVRLIKEEEPPRPSVRLSTSGALAKVAALRKTDPARLSRLVRGELDWVVMRCLEKDRARRYDSASALARDVERYLRDEPVEACPPSAGYRLRKAARKHKKSLAVAVAFAALLLAALGLVTWKWQDERAARAEADLARQDALDKAHKIEQDARRMNEANAALNLGAQHAMVGQWAAAEADHNRAIALRADLSEVWLSRGELYGGMGLWDLALGDYARSFDLRAPDNVRPWLKYAQLQLLRGDEARYGLVCRQILDRFGASNELFVQHALIRAFFLDPGRVRGYDWKAAPMDISKILPTYRWVGHYCRGLVHLRAGRYREAVRELRASLAKTGHPARAMNYLVLAMALHRSGESDAARKELENSRKELGQWTQRALFSRDRLVLWDQWYDWAEFLLNHGEAHRLIERAPPPEDPRQHVLRGRALAALGRQDQADAEYARAVRLAPDDLQIRNAVDQSGAPRARGEAP